jgi:CheY-like chemotaxis protein
MTPIHILLVEDNEGDILLTVDALEESRIANNISVVKDGKQAIDFLSKKGLYTDAETPHLILLDINLPKKNGHEVLKFIKNEESIKHLPVIMLTTSSYEKDILESYKNYASCYISKPVEIADFMGAIAKIETFWFTIVQLPSKNA